MSFTVFRKIKFTATLSVSTRAGKQKTFGRKYGNGERCYKLLIISIL